MDDNNHHIRVSSTDAVMISTYEEGTVWLTVVIQRGRASVIMTKEQVKELIDAMLKAREQ